MISLHGVDKLFQWDTGRCVEVDGKASYVHFAWQGARDPALVVQVRTIEGFRVAEIPNVLLQESRSIDSYAWADGGTLEHKRFKVIARAKPSDYVYVPTAVESVESVKEYVDERMKSIDYSTLQNKPSINGRVLDDGTELGDIGIVSADDSDIDEMFN